jgi:hypothetical protein
LKTSGARLDQANWLHVRIIRTVVLSAEGAQGKVPRHSKTFNRLDGIGDFGPAGIRAPAERHREKVSD